jgi:hypothetical protein
MLQQQLQQQSQILAAATVPRGPPGTPGVVPPDSIHDAPTHVLNPITGHEDQNLYDTPAVNNDSNMYIFDKIEQRYRLAVPADRHDSQYNPNDSNVGNGYSNEPQNLSARANLFPDNSGQIQSGPITSTPRVSQDSPNTSLKSLMTRAQAKAQAQKAASANASNAALYSMHAYDSRNEPHHRSKALAPRAINNPTVATVIKTVATAGAAIAAAPGIIIIK